MVATVIAEDPLGRTVVGQTIAILGFVSVGSTLHAVYAVEGELYMVPTWAIRLEVA